jgi:hypothetical protein
VWFSSQFSVLCDCVTVGNCSLYTLQCEPRGISYMAASYVLSFTVVLFVWDAGSALGGWFWCECFDGAGGKGVLWLVWF